MTGLPVEQASDIIKHYDPSLRLKSYSNDVDVQVTLGILRRRSAYGKERLCSGYFACL